MPLFWSKSCFFQEKTPPRVCVLRPPTDFCTSKENYTIFEATGTRKSRIIYTCNGEVFNHISSPFIIRAVCVVSSEDNRSPCKIALAPKNGVSKILDDPMLTGFDDQQILNLIWALQSHISKGLWKRKSIEAE
jgi:hypothetical protein